ncbi:DUF4331 domain-containing protein [Sulfitobacter guttiformis]|uniref:Uncharacterized protein DUF4331 n=1 Tax=Sulfitobacter guttiformis TaxID=74349 RepID=A0A420DTV4_9RHOB|nr:DUF4331 domain-containing protein [Sulfitobacter guttiformis]KIN71053.1 DUF4331 domain containing protein [Sulfitobacter guttiformis KCTC 32187]RKE97537.1 uncharacterized protein DUF4331 [Sulfitobacter guttiformis]
MQFTNKAVRFAMTVSAAALIASSATASSHREAPGITEQPKVDASDFYMFKSYEPGRGKFITFIANYIPLQAPYGGPNYFTMDPDAIYEIHIDNDGDAVEDITFQFDFANELANDGAGIALQIGDATVAIPLRTAGQITGAASDSLNEIESYTLTHITGDRRSGTRSAVTGPNGAKFAKPLDNIGEKTFPDYRTYADSFINEVTIPGCSTPGKVFVGQRAEAFAVNLGQVFDLVNLVPLEGSIENTRENDDLVGRFNVTSLAIEVPTECVVGTGNGVIGAWTTASLPQGNVEDPSPTYAATSQYGGAFVQQSRLSNPLVNELVIGLPDKDLFNAAEPTQDSALAVYVTNPTLPALVDILFRDALGAPDNIAPSNFPRNDLVAAFLTGFPGFNQQSIVTGSEMMRLNTAVPATFRGGQSPFGVVAEDLAGFPNGRRPGDDVVDIALRVVMGALCHNVPLGAELGVEGAVEDTDSDNINLGYCNPEDAPVGNAPFIDGAPISARDMQNVFPYLNTPLPGAVN